VQSIFSLQQQAPLESESGIKTVFNHFRKRMRAIVATASGASVAIVGAGLLVYFKKRKQN
jgi:LPXTG-motif cell wall-anchored protein